MGALSRISLLLFCGGLLLCAPTAVGQSRSAPSSREKMLQGLLEKGYYDVALDSLKADQNDPRCPEDWQDRVDLQIALVHLEALADGSPLGVENHLAEARESLLRFLKQHPNHPEAYQANGNLGKLLLEEGKALNFRKNQSGLSPAQQETLARESREKLEAAHKYLTAAENEAYERAKSLQSDPETGNNIAKATQRDAVYAQLLDYRIRLAVAFAERARTFPKESGEFKAGLTEAANRFHEIAVKYKNYPAALEAKSAEAHALVELGKASEAQSVLGELHILPRSNAFFASILNEALVLQLELNLAEPSADNLRDSIERLEKWAGSTNLVDRKKLAAAKINLLAARTYLQYAESLKGAESQKAKNAAKNFLAAISTGAAESAAVSELLAKLGNATPLPTEKETTAETNDTNEIRPTTYAEAKEEADRQYRLFLDANRSYFESNESAAKRQAENDRKIAAGKAARSIRTVLESADETVPPETINELRFRRALLAWSLGKIEEAVVLGDFLASRYPQTPEGLKGAELSIKGLQRLFLEAKRGDRDSDRLAARIATAAERIAARWSSLPIAGEARLIRIETELENGNLEKAERFVETLPEGSAERSTAELQLGETLWARSFQKPRPDSETLAVENDNAILEKAKKYLEKGLAGKFREIEQDGGIPRPVLASILTFARLRLSLGENEAVLAMLTDPKTGPLTLLERSEKEGSTILDWDEDIKIDLLVTSLRTFVALGDMNRAETTLARLEALGDGDAVDDTERERRLGNMYLVLGKQLEERLKMLRRSGKQDEIDAVADGFELFLDRIARRQNGTDDRSLRWAGEMYDHLGSGLSNDSEPGTDPDADSIKAKTYFEKAAAIYKTLWEREKSQPGPERTGIALRLSRALRESDRSEEALAILVERLRESETLLDFQIEAARSLQALGKKDKENYIKAIVGDEKKPNGQYLIWGWNGITKRTSSDTEKFKTAYYEANYNKALCRLLLSRMLSGEESTAMRQGAERDILRLEQLRPDLGGPDWSGKFRDLLRQVRR